VRVPSDAQARALAVIEGYVERGKRVRLEGSGLFGVQYRGEWAGHYGSDLRPATVRAVFGYGWVESDAVDGATTLSEDGLIALGVWRSRKLRSSPPELPEMTDRDREVIELAQRALELGYALCARRPARAEARRLRRLGWITDCWVANAARGVVPTPLALVEIRPEQADSPLELPS